RRADDRVRGVARLAIDGVTAADLAGRWGVPQCGLFRALGSTFDAVHDLAAQGALAGTVVIAEEQTAGRGRDGRTWHSPAGGVWWHGEALQWLAVGVGVNVCNAIPSPVAHRAVALGEWLPSVRRLDVLDRLVPALAGLASGEPALSERECTAFAARDWLQGR